MAQAKRTLSVVQQSYSQSKEAAGFERWIYLWRVGLMYAGRLAKPEDYSNLRADLSFYEATYNRETGEDLQHARILELGFGQRPLRLILLHSLGYDVRGIDLDQPLYWINATAIVSLFKSNGAFRALKSLMRRMVFDRSEYSNLARFIFSQYGKKLTFDSNAMVVGDLADAEAWARAGGCFDFIYSEDVFEHIPREFLPQVVSLMAQAMSDNAVAVITPMIFTGIAGGHDLDWYPHRVDLEDRSRGPAWGHLTDETRPGDTFLNKMTRSEFRELFASQFDILREEPTRGDLGRQHLTEQRRQKLKAFDEDELFSNNVRFVLRKKP
jgi:Methyltransferase domain